MALLLIFHVGTCCIGRPPCDSCPTPASATFTFAHSTAPAPSHLTAHRSAVNLPLNLPTCSLHHITWLAALGGPWGVPLPLPPTRCPLRCGGTCSAGPSRPPADSIGEKDSLCGHVDDALSSFKNCTFVSSQWRLFRNLAQLTTARMYKCSRTFKPRAGSPICTMH